MVCVCVCMWLCVAVYGRMYLHAVIARFELPSLNHAGDVIGWLAKASFLFFFFFFAVAADWRERRPTSKAGVTSDL